MVDVIGDNSIVPVGEDLTTEKMGLQVLRGFDKMNRVDVPVADGKEFLEGEWGVIDGSGNLDRPGSTPVPNTYLVFAGTNRFDSHATGQASVIMSGDVVVKTERYDDGESYAIGDALTAKDLGGGEAYVTKQSGSEPVLARVLEVGEGYLKYQLMLSNKGN